MTDVFEDIIRHKRCVNCGCKMIHHEIYPMDMRTGKHRNGPCEDCECNSYVDWLQSQGKKWET
jgi:hypothetical protein